MVRRRVIPCLLLKDRGLVKTVKFKEPKYVGDPINAIRIFNEKEVDELVLLDIDASRLNREPNYELIAEVAGECFMPICYGGGIKSLSHAEKVFSLGIEKIALNGAALDDLSLVSKIADKFGSQSVVGSMDCRKGFWGGYSVYSENGTKDTKRQPVEWAQELEAAGVGEIFLNSIDRDGTQKGFDVSLVESVVSQVHVPVIACGGASSTADLVNLFDRTGVSAVAAGSLFVFHGKHRAVLISYPDINVLNAG
ncbi:AglZ/HisF2 family acetamidino modification protein [Pseudomonas sp. TYF_15]|uniref:AglZ/HisF2 family acetamidino modification protein n=1 Tax=Pseudomonas TaxID=286 RepID=UPI0003AEA670|nr:MULTISPECIES: AglZ/HisF2 family acetamidino modification protein [Pseudomonas]EKT4496640.1 imidazole glycerol phosphate synthase subunit HisF [Pseudomonas putida]EKT8867634.1 imidazole glycerol phosphate synthase subunit HisF [Pseudomonas putida]ERL01505.1 imidazole glycerol phosphate synthase [Pseudomonas putida LF54]MDF3175034.1 AglZ/HisF2 family acetamidino modification protein [Pseudomonas sp. ER28]MDY7074165.1 Imidazole glycerol phosphate synthase subunit HisF [Pseudomonas hunanensis]